MEGISTTIYMPNTALPKTNQEGACGMKSNTIGQKEM
jgi:hypothetical protein